VKTVLENCKTRRYEEERYFLSSVPNISIYIHGLQITIFYKVQTISELLTESY
jgi:hypothetical protein